MARVTIKSTTDQESHDFYTTYPALGASSAELLRAVYSDANPLPPEVREAVRMRVALINDCLVCKGARPMPQLGEAFYDNIAEFRSHPEIYSEAQRVAMEYAELFCLDHLTIGEEMFARLARCFTEAQVAGLTISVGYFLAFGRLTRVLMLDHFCPIEPAAAA